MNWLVRGLNSSIGTKYLMAVTGLLLLLFVITHMVGNLQIYLGPEVFNGYAEMMQGLGTLLWAMRLGLLLILLVHVRCAVKLTAEAKEARPVPYAMKRSVAASYASRTMFMTGMIVLAFIVFHILHFTTGTFHADLYAEAHEGSHPDMYSMFVKSFHHAPTAIAYMTAMVLVGIHLSHGVSSLFQSMGFVRPKYREMIRVTGLGITGAIVAGNISMPLMCIMNIVEVPGVSS
ncbi:MAG: succinate:quinone oxidoreductase [Planctomycetes bacterium]|nr:succinate:quinone oxidoreductase [Planctomycetota bacterium]